MCVLDYRVHQFSSGPNYNEYCDSIIGIITILDIGYLVKGNIFINTPPEYNSCNKTQCLVNRTFFIDNYKIKLAINFYTSNTESVSFSLACELNAKGRSTLSKSIAGRKLSSTEISLLLSYFKTVILYSGSFNTAILGSLVHNFVNYSKYLYTNKYYKNYYFVNTKPNGKIYITKSSAQIYQQNIRSYIYNLFFKCSWKFCSGTNVIRLRLSNTYIHK